MRRRGYGGDARAVNNTLETINAAATVIASRENPHPQPHVQKKRWGNWLSISSCFGYHKNRKRISHVALVPETTLGTQPSSSAVAAAAAVSSTQAAPIITLPFVAPPSSPASFLQSEPPSAAQSPVGMLSLNSASASMYSPGGPASIFAIGPYAHETQLVSPPVFSTFTTEPSTAPFTPPPESVHLTTPSSPEVPFAQLLDPNNRNGETFQRIQISQYDFHSYQLHPGSPAGQLISPRSAFSASGTSSPYLPDSECGSNLHFQTSDPPKLLNLDKLSICENPESRQGSGSLTPDAVRSSTHGGFHPSHRVPEIKTSPHRRCNRQNEISVNHHRVSFELSAQEVIKCVENKAMAWNKALTKFKTEAYRGDREENYSSDSRQRDKFHVTETPKDALQKSNDDDRDASRVHQKDPSLTHNTNGREFNFDSAVAGKLEEGSSNDWSFFPMIQPGLS